MQAIEVFSPTAAIAATAVIAESGVDRDNRAVHGVSVSPARLPNDIIIMHHVRSLPVQARAASSPCPNNPVHGGAPPPTPLRFHQFATSFGTTHGVA